MTNANLAAGRTRIGYGVYKDAAGNYYNNGGAQISTPASRTASAAGANTNSPASVGGGPGIADPRKLNTTIAPYQAAQVAQIAPYQAATAATIDRSQIDPVEANYATLNDQLQQQANGQGPSLATLQLQDALQKSQASNLSLASSQRGNSGLGIRSAIDANTLAGNTAAQAAAEQRVTEQLNARNQLGLNYNNQAQNEGLLASNQAKFASDVASANAQYQNQNAIAQGQIGEQTAVANAGNLTDEAKAQLAANEDLRKQGYINATNTGVAGTYAGASILGSKLNFASSVLNDQLNNQGQGIASAGGTNATTAANNNNVPTTGSNLVAAGNSAANVYKITNPGSSGSGNNSNTNNSNTNNTNNTVTFR